MLDEKQKRKKKGRNCVSYNYGLYLFSQKKRNCGLYSYKKKCEKPSDLYSTTPIILAKNVSCDEEIVGKNHNPVLNSYHTGKKCVLSIIIEQKGPKRGRKAIIAKNVSHDGTPIKHGLLHLW